MAAYIQTLYPNKRIIDATKPVDLNVTSRDIKKADPSNPRACAFAQCLLRTEPIEEAIVWKTTAYLVYPRRVVRYKVNGSLQNEIVALDRGGEFAPGTYTLIPFSPANRLGGLKKSPNTTPVQSTKGTKPVRLVAKSTFPRQAALPTGKTKVKAVPHRTVSIRDPR